MNTNLSSLSKNITPKEFGVPTEYCEHAENYAQWMILIDRDVRSIQEPLMKES